MTPDILMITMVSLGLAAVFLALVIGLSGNDAAEMAATIASMRPSVRRQARYARLNDMTRLADEAIEVRKLGKRIQADNVF
jgi:hypothetical protein